MGNKIDTVIGRTVLDFFMGAPGRQASTYALVLQLLQASRDEEGDVPAKLYDDARSILRNVSVPLAEPEIEAAPEELDLVWRVNGKTLKLITYNDQSPKLYYQVDAENTFTRGHFLPGTSDSLSEKLSWLAA